MSNRDSTLNVLRGRLSTLPSYVKGVILFGSTARGEATGGSDIDLLVLHEGLNVSDIVERRRTIYKEVSEALQGIFPTTVIDMELESFLKPKTITPLLLNIYYDAIVILDRTGKLQEFIKSVKGRIEKSGLIRGRSEKSYYWILPSGEGGDTISLNPIEEVKYRYNLALQNLSRAENLLNLRDWAGSVHFSQLAVENFAKALVAIFEVPAWGHDPSRQLLELRNRFPKQYINEIDELSSMTRTLAPEHSTYGEPERGLTPTDIYSETHAVDAFNKARKAKETTRKILEALKILQHKTT